MAEGTIGEYKEGPQVTLLGAIGPDGKVRAVQTDSDGNLVVDPGGGNPAVTIADGADVAQGAIADAAVTNPASSASVVALLKGLLTEMLLQVASLSVIDDWDESDRLKANIIAGQAGVAGGVGSVGASTQRTIKAGSTTGTTTSVGDSASSVTLLAANTSRVGATIYNDSSALLYLRLGATASTSSFTAILAGNGSGIGGYYEVPFGYNGIIDGIWASDAGGNARITEVT